MNALGKTCGAPIRHGGALAAAIERYGGDPADWIDLSTGINPNPPALPAVPPAAWERLPDADLFAAARHAAAMFYGLAADQGPLPVPGIQAVIQVLPALAGAKTAPRRASILSPAYGEYAHVLTEAGFAIDAAATFAAIDADADIVVVINPNNPDARRTRRIELLQCAGRIASRGGLLVVDEAFADLDPSDSLADEAGRRDGLLVLRSFGKFFGLAGLRLGFAMANSALRARLASALGPWAVSGPALAVAVGLLPDRDLAAALRTQIRRRRDATRTVLEQAGLSVIGDAGLFLLVETGEAADLAEALARRHILVRRFDEAPSWLRFGLTADGAEADRLGNALRARTSPANAGR